MIVEKTLSLRGTPELVAILNKWGSSRPRAIEDIATFVSRLSDIPYEEAESKLHRAFRQQKYIDISDVEEVPGLLKVVVSVDEDRWSKAMNLFTTVFSLKQQPQMPFFIKVGGIACINDMENENIRPKQAEERHALDIPEMAKRFAQILLAPDSTEYCKIEQILRNWRN